MSVKEASFSYTAELVLPEFHLESYLFVKFPWSQRAASGNAAESGSRFRDVVNCLLAVNYY